MTLDYNIVLPTILAVAVSLGTRRWLSPETIYTLKLARRGHAAPKALHANLFLVRSAAEVMETDAVVLDESYFFATFIDTSVGGLRHIVATKEGRPYGVIRVNADLRRAIGTVTEAVTVGELSQKNFITVHAGDAMYDVIGEMSKEKAVAAVVVSSVKEGDRETVLGIITKDYIADAVAGSIEVFNG